MFDEKQLEQYRSIKAPQSLRTRVMSQENKTAKIISFPFKAMAVAACIAVVVSAFVFTNNSTSVSISSAPVAVSRSTDTCVVLDVDVKDEAVLTVSDGKLRASDSENLAECIELYDSAQLIWSVDYDKTYTLKLESGRKTEVYSLDFNEHSQLWEFEKINQNKK